MNEHNIEIGAGLGALTWKIWRIGLIGYTSNKENINVFLSAFQGAIKNN